MCNVRCLSFAERAIAQADVAGKRVIEVGSYDYNGTIRQLTVDKGPSEYVGVDIVSGPGVDEICRIEQLVERFGPESFDLVVCTEVVEHVADWRAALWNLKTLVRAGGALVVTTRSRGFHFHGYPADYWRYEIEDFRLIFSDMDIELLEQDDVTSPGVFIRARRRGEVASIAEMQPIALYSVIRRHRIARSGEADVYAARALTQGKAIANRVLPSRAKKTARSALTRMAR